MVEHGYRQRRLGETHGVKGEMTEEVIRIVPRERIFDGVHEQIVFLNGPWVTVAGGDDEYTKKLIASDGLYSPKGSGNRDDVVSGRERLALEKLANVVQPNSSQQQHKSKQHRLAWQAAQEREELRVD